MKWRYNGRASFSTILAWCYQHLDVDDWETNMNGTIWFKAEPAYTMFMLKWG